MGRKKDDGPANPRVPTWRWFQRKNKKGRGLERFIAAIQFIENTGAKIRRNERISGREFDVTVRMWGEDGQSLLTLIECRDGWRKILATEVEAFVTKSTDAGASRKIMVSHKGFTGGAKRVAQRHGIELWTLHELITELPRQVVNVRTVTTICTHLTTRRERTPISRWVSIL